MESFHAFCTLLLAIDPVLHHRRLYVQGFDDVLAAEISLEDFTRCVRQKKPGLCALFECKQRSNLRCGVIEARRARQRVSGEIIVVFLQGRMRWLTAVDLPDSSLDKKTHPHSRPRHASVVDA